MSFLEQYKSAFKRCYPQKTIDHSHAKRRHGEVDKWWIVVDGDRGERPLTEAELRQATRDFQK